MKASFDATPLLALYTYAGLLGAEAGPRCGYPVAGRAELLPPLGVLDTFVERHRRHARRRAHLEAIVVEVHRAFDLDAARIATGIDCAALDDVEVGAQLHLVEHGVVREPPVRETSGSFERDG